MVVRLKKASGKKLNNEINSIIQKELAALAKELNKEFESKIKDAKDGLKLEFDSVIANLALAFSGGKFDARSFANSTARSFAPMLKDFLNKSLAQQGDDFLGIISKAQRNN